MGISTAPGERGVVSGTIDGALALNARISKRLISADLPCGSDTTRGPGQA